MPGERVTHSIKLVVEWQTAYRTQVFIEVIVIHEGLSAGLLKETRLSSERLLQFWPAWWEFYQMLDAVVGSSEVCLWGVRGRHVSVLQVCLSSILSHQGWTKYLHLPLVARHHGGMHTAVNGCHHHQDTHSATDHPCNYLSAMCSSHSDRSVTLVDALFIAADPAEWPGRFITMTWCALIVSFLWTHAEHFCGHTADVPALQLSREAAPHGIYMSICKEKEQNKLPVSTGQVIFCHFKS